MMRFILPIPEKLLEKGFAMPRIDRAGLIPRKLQTKKGYWQTFYIRPIEEHEMEGAAKKGRTKQSDYFIRDMSEMDVARVKRNEDALRTFYKTNDRLIGAMVRNWIDRLYAHKPKMSRADEDAQQVGRLALWEAVSTFDPKKAITLSTTGEPATFGTYAYRRLRDALREYFVPAATKKRGGMGVDVMGVGPGEVSLDKPVTVAGEGGEEEVTLGETIAAHEPVAMDEAIYQRMNADRILQEVYQKLNPTQSKVLQILIEQQRTSGRPATHSAVAKQLGMTRQGVEKHLARIKQLSGWVMREMYPAKTASKVIERIVAEEMLKAIESLGLTDVPDDVLEKVGERMEKALFENIVTLEKALQEPKIGWVMRVGQSLLEKAKRIFVSPSGKRRSYYRTDPRAGLGGALVTESQRRTMERYGSRAGEAQSAQLEREGATPKESAKAKGLLAGASVAPEKPPVAQKWEHPFSAWQKKKGMKPLDFEGHYQMANYEHGQRRKQFEATREGQEWAKLEHELGKEQKKAAKVAAKTGKRVAIGVHRIPGTNKDEPFWQAETSGNITPETAPEGVTLVGYIHPDGKVERL